MELGDIKTSEDFIKYIDEHLVEKKLLRQAYEEMQKEFNEKYTHEDTIVPAEMLLERFGI